MWLRIQKNVFDKQVLENIQEIVEINKIKKEEYKWESMYSTFELSEKLWFLSVEKLLFIRWIWDKINRISSLSKKWFIPSVSWETIFDTCNDLVNYSALLLDYLYWWTDKEYQNFFIEIWDIFKTKNWDYSNTNNDAISNFNQIEEFWLWKTEDWMLWRVAIKIQRIANFLNKKASKERIKEEIIDLAVYTLIFSNYLKFKFEFEKWEKLEWVELNTLKEVENIKKDDENLIKEEIKEKIKEEKRVETTTQNIEEIFHEEKVKVKKEEKKEDKKKEKKQEISNDDLWEIWNLTDEDLNNIIQDVENKSEEIWKMVSEKMIENEKQKQENKETPHNEEVALEESSKENSIFDETDISNLI